MMCTTFKNITNGPIRGILKLFFQNFIMHRNRPGTSCMTFSRHKLPGRSDRSAGMATSACANAGRGMHGTAALEDQGPALRLTDLWQTQVGSHSDISRSHRQCVCGHTWRRGHRCGCRVVVLVHTLTQPPRTRRPNHKVPSANNLFP